MFNIYLDNFRGFKKQKLEFSRINILIGENSGGKSSLLKYLLSINQTLDHPHESNLKLKGELVDLGNYNEIIYKKDKSKNLKLGFSSGVEYIDHFLKAIYAIKPDDEEKNKIIIEFLKDAQHFPTNIEIKLNQKLNDHSSIRTKIWNEGIGEITFKSRSNSTSYQEQSTNMVFDLKSLKGTLKNCITTKHGFFTYFDIDIEENLEQNYKDYKPKELFYKIVFLLLYQNYCADKIKFFRFINPISTEPKRIYFQQDKHNDYQKFNIEKVINILGNSTISEKAYKERIEDLNKIVQAFGIADEVRLVKNDELSVVSMEIKKNNFWSNITDVGYGVSLQIPILFQALMSEQYTRKTETLLIEQPEIHLHPSLQSKFIDTLLGIGKKNNYFIETHSEHIIRKLQIIVKEKKYGIKPEDICIHYFKSSEEKFIITSHKINTQGILSPKFPTGFYDMSYKLVKDLM